MHAEGTRIRRCARIVVVNQANAILLVRYIDPMPVDPRRPDLLTYWVPPGGGARVGESFEQAAIRELEEETGVEQVEIGPQVWARERHLIRNGKPVRNCERYFIAWGESSGLLRNRTPERIDEIRWWALEDMRRSSEIFLPEPFVELVTPLLRGELPPAPMALA